MLTSPEAAAVMREYLEERASRLAESMDGTDAQLRATVGVSSILGLTITRHFLGLPVLKGLDDDQIATLAETWLARLA